MMRAHWIATRCTQDLLVRPGLPGLTGEDGANINGPSLIRVPDWADRPLGRYYLYFAHHGGTYIRLAFADALEGPWRIHPPGVLRLERTAARGHIASPDVHVDHARREIRMYFHGNHPSGPKEAQMPQVSFVAISRDGLQFEARPTVLGWFYFRVFEYDGRHYAIAKRANEGGLLYRSPDGLTPFEEGPQILPRMRHAAVLRQGRQLHIFFSRIGDSPESILVSRMDLTDDWRQWRPSEPQLLLEPQGPAEGADLSVEPSKAGAVKGRVRQLRDPCIFTEDNEIHLLYTVAGEQGIARAALHPPNRVQPDPGSPGM